MLRLMFRKELGVLLLFLLLSTAGLYLVSLLGVQLYPRTSRPAVTSTLTHRGYSAIAFSREYGEMIESQLMGIPGLSRLEMRYGSNATSFTITFDWEADAEKALSDTETALSQIESRLPGDLFGVSRVRFSTGENAGFLILGISSPTVVAEDLYRMMTGPLESRLSQVDDVEMVEILSVEELDVSITLRQHDLLRYGLTIIDVSSALQQSSAIQSIGSVREGRSSVSVHVAAKERTLPELGRLVVHEENGAAIYLEDVADVEIGFSIPSSTFVMEGNRGIQLVATPVDGGNIRNMSQEIIRLVREARDSGELPEDARINLLLDPAEYVNRSIANVVQAALIGAFLAMVMVFLTLGKIRNTLLIGISLPVSLILSFILLYIFGITLNLISLGGMALAVGMIVDSSIVVIENIHRFRQEEKHTNDTEQLQDLIIRATGQVRSPVIASTLTSILVFLPITFTAPLTNAILGEQSMVVVFALGFALLVALTLIPLVAYLVYRRQLKLPGGFGDGENGKVVLERTKNISTRGIGFLERGYLRLLKPLVSSPRKAMLMIFTGFFAFALSAFFLLPRIPREILSPPASDRIIIFMRPTGEVDSAEIAQEVIPAMSNIIKDELGPYIENIYGEVRGRFNRLFVVLNSPRDAEHVQNRLEELFVSDNDWYYGIMSWDPARLPLPWTNDLQVSVTGPDETEVITVLERLRDIVAEAEIYQRITTIPATNYTDELVMHPRSEIIENTPGFTEPGLVQLLQRALGGTPSVEYQHEGLTVDARAVYPEELLQGRIRFENFLIPYEEGALPVKHFFDFTTASNASQIASEDGELIYRLYANLRWGSGAGERSRAEAEIAEIIEEKLELPAGYSFQLDNPQAEMDNAIESLFISLALSVALIYLLLTFQFNSFRAPLVILVSIPMGFLGVLLSLFIFKSSLSLNSLLGAILMSGVVVNNAIILVDFYLQALNEYPTREKALLESARLRFRPILITTLTTIMGMLPIAIGLGEGANVIQPLGIAVSGGLAVSTLMTLFMVPSMLTLVRLRPKS
jgi:hydrophobic/amphiphilic exporter-1 (mainly G- bacteria), HAE1 family